MDEKCPNCGYDLSEQPDYIDEFSNVVGKNIVMGGRVVGKSEMLLERSEYGFKRDEDILVIAPKYENAMVLRDRFVEKCPSGYIVTHKRRFVSSQHSSVSFASSEDIRNGKKITEYDTILVDNATDISQTIVKQIYNSGTKTICFAGTPNPNKGIVERLAAYDYGSTTWHINGKSSPLLPESKIEEMYSYLSNRRFECDVQGKYWEEDVEYFRPDHSY